MHIDNVSIGKNIRSKRKANNLTLETLAEKCNMSINFLGNIERGTDTPSLKSLLNICNALNVNADSILLENLNVYDGNIDYQKSIDEEVNSMTAEQQGKVYKMIKTLQEF